ncbi:MAG: hypothetical protein V1712_02180 [Patescibacteria group bacterium]
MGPEGMSNEQLINSDSDTKSKIRSHRELKDEACKDAGIINRPFKSKEEILMIDQEVEKKKLLVGGAELVFGEDGSTRLELTAEQIEKIKLEWERFVKDTKDRYENASDKFIQKAIKDLENGRRRNVADKSGYAFSPLAQIDYEQLERAALKQVLKDREEKE